MAAALRSGNQDGLFRLQVITRRPGSLHQRLGREQLPGSCVQDVEEPVLGRGHHDVAPFAVNRQVRHHDLIVFVVHAFGAGLVVPDVFSRLRIDRNDALREKFFAGDLCAGHFAVANVSAGSAKNDEPGGVVIRNGMPHIAAADFPGAFSVPGFRGHFQFFGFERLRRIAGNRPETPDFLASFGIVGCQCTADRVVRAVVAHQNFRLGHARRSGDSGLRGLANRGFPNFVGGRRVNGNQAAIARADVDFAVPNGHASVRSRRVRAVQSLVQANLRIVFPEEFSGASFDSIDFRKWGTDVNHAVHHDGFGDHAHQPIVIEVPSQTQVRDVRGVDLLEWAEMF